MRAVRRVRAVAAVVAGLVASPDGGAPVIFVRRISSAIGRRSAVLGVLTLAAGMATVGAVRRVGSVTQSVVGLSAALLLLSGAYVIYYWLSAGRLLA